MSGKHSAVSARANNIAITTRTRFTDNVRHGSICNRPNCDYTTGGSYIEECKVGSQKLAYEKVMRLGTARSRPKKQEGFTAEYAENSLPPGSSSVYSAYSAVQLFPDESSPPAHNRKQGGLTAEYAEYAEMCRRVGSGMHLSLRDRAAIVDPRAGVERKSGAAVRSADFVGRPSSADSIGLVDTDHDHEVGSRVKQHGSPQ